MELGFLFQNSTATTQMVSGQKGFYNAQNVAMSVDIHGSEERDQTTVKSVGLKWMVVAMDNKLYRIEVIMYDNLPTIDTAGMLITNEGVAYVKLHPVKIKATPKSEVVHGRWIHDINNLYGCSECMGRETMSHKKMKNYCPNCGAIMDGDKHE